MLELDLYEESLLSWYHMYELSRCRIALHKGCLYELFLVLLSYYCIDLCN